MHPVFLNWVPGFPIAVPGLPNGVPGFPKGVPNFPNGVPCFLIGVPGFPNYNYSICDMIEFSGKDTFGAP